MVKEEIDEILSFWRARQSSDSGKKTFRFKQCFKDSSNKDLEPATYGAAATKKAATGGCKRSGKQSKTNQQQLEEVSEETTSSVLPLPGASDAASVQQEQLTGQSAYNLGFPADGDCNMTTAGDDVAHSAEEIAPFDEFHLDPELAQIALGIQQDAGYATHISDFMTGGVFDQFLDSLNNGRIEYQDQLVLPPPPMDNAHLHEQLIRGPLEEVTGPGSAPPPVSLPSVPTAGTITRSSLRSAASKQKEALKMTRGRSKRVVDDENVDNASHKRGHEDMEGESPANVGGPRKKAKANAVKKPTKQKANKKV